MSEFETRMPRSERTVKREAEALFNAIRGQFLEMMPSETEETFNARFAGPITSGDELLEKMQTMDLPTQGLLVVNALIVAATYCYQAVEAFQRQDAETDWTYLMDAAFIYGKVSRNDGEPLVASRLLGHAGGQAKASKAREEKRRVREFCREQWSSAPSGNWLRDRVMGEDGLTSASESTVRGWITEFAKDWGAPGTVTE